MSRKKKPTFYTYKPAKKSWVSENKGFLAAILIALILCGTGIGIASHKSRDKNAKPEYKHLKITKYITPAEYKGLKYKLKKQTVSDKEIKAQIESNRQANSKKKKSTKGTIGKKDAVYVDYVVRRNGKPIKNGTKKNAVITLNNNPVLCESTLPKNTVKEFIGKKAGDTVTGTITLPKVSENIDKKDLGKKADIEMKIGGKQITVVPKYDLDFVKKHSKCKSIKEYEEKVKKDILKEKEESARSSVKSNLLEQITKKTKVKKYPKKQLRKETEAVTEKYKNMAAQYGISYNEFAKQVAGSKKKMEKQISDAAKKTCKQKMIVQDIANKENIKVTNREYKNYLKEKLKSYGMTGEQFKNMYGQSIEAYGEDNDFRFLDLYDKVMEKTIKYGKNIAV